MKNIRFTSHLSRTRGGIGFNSDPRVLNRLEEMGCTVGETTLPGELRPWSKRLGKGQSWDFFSVVEPCACCGEMKPVNIVMLCGQCATENLRGDGPSEEPRIAHQVARHVHDAHARIHGSRLAMAGA